MSTGPAGVNGTTIRTVRAGKSCACSNPQKKSARAAKSLAMLLSSESVCAERPDVDLRRFTCHQLGDGAAGARRAAHADVAVPEGIEHPRRARRRTDDRDAVGQA